MTELIKNWFVQEVPVGLSAESEKMIDLYHKLLEQNVKLTVYQSKIYLAKIQLKEVCAGNFKGDDESIKLYSQYFTERKNISESKLFSICKDMGKTISKLEKMNLPSHIGKGVRNLKLEKTRYLICANRR